MPLKNTLVKLISLTILLISTTTNAHLLKVFAYTQMSGDMQNMTTNGKVYFAGGAAVADLALEIVDSQGALIKALKSNSEGKFSVELKSGKYQLLANTQDGHIAKWPITPPKNHVQSSTASKSTISANKDLVLVDQSQINQALAEIVSSQILPISEQLNALQERTKLQDIIGALGYIFGLYGLAMWWRHRKIDPIETDTKS